LHTGNAIAARSAPPAGHCQWHVRPRLQLDCQHECWDDYDTVRVLQTVPEVPASATLPPFNRHKEPPLQRCSNSLLPVVEAASYRVCVAARYKYYR
jgi:hypothetical protein